MFGKQLFSFAILAIALYQVSDAVLMCGNNPCPPGPVRVNWNSADCQGSSVTGESTPSSPGTSGTCLVRGTGAIMWWCNSTGLEIDHWPGSTCTGEPSSVNTYGLQRCYNFLSGKNPSSFTYFCNSTDLGVAPVAAPDAPPAAPTGTVQIPNTAPCPRNTCSPGAAYFYRFNNVGCVGVAQAYEETLGPLDTCVNRQNTSNIYAECSDQVLRTSYYPSGCDTTPYMIIEKKRNLGVCLDTPSSGPMSASSVNGTECPTITTLPPISVNPPANSPTLLPPPSGTTPSSNPPTSSPSSVPTANSPIDVPAAAAPMLTTSYGFSALLALLALLVFSV